MVANAEDIPRFPSEAGLKRGEDQADQNLRALARRVSRNEWIELAFFPALKVAKFSLGINSRAVSVLYLSAWSSFFNIAIGFPKKSSSFFANLRALGAAPVTMR